MTIILTVIALAAAVLIVWSAPEVIRQHRRDVAERQLAVAVARFEDALTAAVVAAQAASGALLKMARSFESTPLHPMAEHWAPINTSALADHPKGTP